MSIISGTFDDDFCRIFNILSLKKILPSILNNLQSFTIVLKIRLVEQLYSYLLLYIIAITFSFGHKPILD